MKFENALVNKRGAVGNEVCFIGFTRRDVACNVSTFALSFSS